MLPHVFFAERLALADACEALLEAESALRRNPNGQTFSHCLPRLSDDPLRLRGTRFERLRGEGRSLHYEDVAAIALGTVDA